MKNTYWYVLIAGVVVVGLVIAFKKGLLGAWTQPKLLPITQQYHGNNLAPLDTVSYPVAQQNFRAGPPGPPPVIPGAVGKVLADIRTGADAVKATVNDANVTYNAVKKLFS